MSSKVSLGTLGVFVANCSLSQMAYAQQADPHGWLARRRLKRAPATSSSKMGIQWAILLSGSSTFKNSIVLSKSTPHT